MCCRCIWAIYWVCSLLCPVLFPQSAPWICHCVCADWVIRGRCCVYVGVWSFYVFYHWSDVNKVFKKLWSVFTEFSRHSSQIKNKHEVEIPLFSPEYNYSLALDHTTTCFMISTILMMMILLSGSWWTK
jgi:hypothetical protein